ncbi:class I SAM-dependent methyltransferase [Falsiroseomonas sp. HW251]|uniref:class I SAM-dependent methyltransferase n=1 Tax=Falsiroseomonas sp. HW251 TaxID=3390998 RepID=UPI003D321396
MTYNHAQSLRALARHLMFRSGLDSVRIGLNRWRGFNMDHLSVGGERAQVFSAVYRDGIWVHREGQDSRSGIGSTSDATQLLRSRLKAVLDELHCRRLVDVGCGDFNWMRHVQGDWDYIGLDIVEDVIARNAERYGGPRRAFQVLDATRDPLPAGDVVLCREVLFHLSHASALGAVRNMAASGARWLVATSDMQFWFNADIRDGDYRRLNLCRPPFRLPPPQRIIPDDSVAPGRVLGIWPMESVQA